MASIASFSEIIVNNQYTLFVIIVAIVVIGGGLTAGIWFLIDKQKIYRLWQTYVKKNILSRLPITCWKCKKENSDPEKFPMRQDFSGADHYLSCQHCGAPVLRISAKWYEKDAPLPTAFREATPTKIAQFFTEIGRPMTPAEATQLLQKRDSKELTSSSTQA